MSISGVHQDPGFTWTSTQYCPPHDWLVFEHRDWPEMEFRQCERCGHREWRLVGEWRSTWMGEEE